MPRLNCIILIVIFTCCNSKQIDKNILIQSPQQDSVSIRNQIKQKTKFDKTLLEGVWWLNEDSNTALFSIIGDSLYYTDEVSSPYLIVLREDSLSIMRDDYQVNFILKALSKDSLVFFDSNIQEYIVLVKK